MHCLILIRRSKFNFRSKCNWFCTTIFFCDICRFATVNCAYFRSVAFSKLFKVFAWKYSLLRKSRAVDHFSTGREKKNRKFLFSFQCLVTFLFDENDLLNIFLKDDATPMIISEEQLKSPPPITTTILVNDLFDFFGKLLIWKRILGNHTWFCSPQQRLLRYLFSFTSAVASEKKKRNIYFRKKIVSSL